MKRNRELFLCSFAVIICAVMAVIFCGCGKDSGNAQKDITSLSDILSESLSYEGIYTDDVGNTYNYSYHVPKLLIDTPASEALNEKIGNRMMEYIENELENMDMQCSLTAYKCGYSAYLNDNILSLVIFIHTDFDYSEYFSVNIDVHSGREIPNEELLNISGYGLDDFTAMQKNALERGFFELYGEMEQDFESDGDSLYNEVYNNTLSNADSLSECFVYFGPLHELRFIGKIYSFGGADFYYYTFSAENKAEPFVSEIQTRLD